VDFRNTLIILTSNLGSHFIRELAGKDDAAMRAQVLEALKAAFRPEFLNRIDESIIFNTLSRRDLERIVDIQLGRLRGRLADRKLALVVSDQAKAFLAREGFDPVYGARPLKRTLQRLLQDPLARRLLEGQFTEGDTVRVDLQGGEISFARA
jgi:ATP-dependent Clp protease ATP-binding subunit ClpB